MRLVAVIRVNKKILSIAAVCAAWVAILAFTSYASPIDAYQKRIESAKTAIDGLSEDLDSPGTSLERSRIEQLKNDLPATEHLEWQGGSVDTQNQWLHDRLDEFAAEPDPERRIDILDGITERLDGIIFSLAELNNRSHSTSSKDLDKQKLSQILLREEFQKPKAPETSLFQQWLDAFWDWLERLFPKPEVSPAASTDYGSLKLGLQILIFALVIGLLGFLVYRFTPFLLRRAAKRDDKNGADRVILGERIASDMSASSLFGEAEALARDGDLRGAIRKGYVALLCELSDRHIVRLAHNKTNRDYLRDVRKNAGLLENMRGVTGKFERSWYGLRPVDLADWEDFRKGYMRAIDTARKG